jgi:hypothetical protein
MPFYLINLYFFLSELRRALYIWTTPHANDLRRTLYEVLRLLQKV